MCVWSKQAGSHSFSRLAVFRKPAAPDMGQLFWCWGIFQAFSLVTERVIIRHLSNKDDLSTWGFLPSLLLQQHDGSIPLLPLGNGHHQHWVCKRESLVAKHSFRVPSQEGIHSFSNLSVMQGRTRRQVRQSIVPSSGLRIQVLLSPQLSLASSRFFLSFMNS